MKLKQCLWERQWQARHAKILQLLKCLRSRWRYTYEIIGLLDEKAQKKEHSIISRRLYEENVQTKSHLEKKKTLKPLVWAPKTCQVPNNGKRGSKVGRPHVWPKGVLKWWNHRTKVGIERETFHNPRKNQMTLYGQRTGTKGEHMLKRKDGNPKPSKEGWKKLK